MSKKTFSENVKDIHEKNGAQVVEQQRKPPEPEAQSLTEKAAVPVTIERDLGGFRIYAVIENASPYRRVREQLNTLIDDFLRPYIEEGLRMHRVDASKVCSALSEQLRGSEISFVTPFSIRPDVAQAVSHEQPSPPPQSPQAA